MLDPAPAVAALVAALLNVGVTTLLASRQGQFQKRLAWFKQRPALFRAVLASIGGAVMLVLAYSFLFDRTGTGGYSDVAGMLNANQGVLTLVGLIIAGLTVIVSVVGRESIAIENRKTERARINKRLRLALDEAMHNLMHIAQLVGAQGQNLVRELPQVSFIALDALMRDPKVESLHDRVLSKAGTILRYQDYLRGAPIKNSFSNAGRQSPARAHAYAHAAAPHGAAVNGSGVPAPRIPAPPEHLQRTVETLALHCLSLVHRIDVHHNAAVSETLETPLRAKLCKALRRGSGGQFYFRSSNPEVNGARLRADDEPLMVWVNDNPQLYGVDIIEVGQIVYDILVDGH